MQLPSQPARDRRFEFGKNWQRFLQVVDEGRIAGAESSLLAMLGVKNLCGQSFLDVGTGSGLFSLAAARLGAERVHSFDYDRLCVACAQELKTRYCRVPTWTIEQGDILDARYFGALGQFAIVYSWGVLHHTGHMWEALENVSTLVAPGGRLFIAIYNKQVYWTAVASRIKRAYVAAPRPEKWLILGGYITLQVSKGLVKDALLLRNPLQRYRSKRLTRGMSTLHDWVDWVGGYPFETARPEEIFRFFRPRGFSLERLETCGGGHGCNQFVFSRPGSEAVDSVRESTSVSAEARVPAACEMRGGCLAAPAA